MNKEHSDKKRIMVVDWIYIYWLVIFKSRRSKWKRSQSNTKRKRTVRKKAKSNFSKGFESFAQLIYLPFFSLMYETFITEIHGFRTT